MTFENVGDMDMESDDVGDDVGDEDDVKDGNDVTLEKVGNVEVGIDVGSDVGVEVMT